MTVWHGDYDDNMQNQYKAVRKENSEENIRPKIKKEGGCTIHTHLEDEKS